MINSMVQQWWLFCLQCADMHKLVHNQLLADVVKKLTCVVCKFNDKKL